MDLTKESIEKIVSLAENKTYKIGNTDYSDKELVPIHTSKTRTCSIEVNSLDAIVQLIKREHINYEQLFIRVAGFDKVDVFTEPDEESVRTYLYEARCDVPVFREGWRNQEKAIIELRSLFAPTKDQEEIIQMISNLTDENIVKTADDGVSQAVTVRQGVALNRQHTIKPINKLIPFRTFLEIVQPVSEFLLRLREGGEVGLFEADGGMWKLLAKKSIKEYFEKELDYLSSKITIMI